MLVAGALSGPSMLGPSGKIASSSTSAILPVPYIYRRNFESVLIAAFKDAANGPALVPQGVLKDHETLRGLSSTLMQHVLQLCLLLLLLSYWLLSVKTISQKK